MGASVTSHNTKIVLGELFIFAIAGFLFLSALFGGGGGGTDTATIPFLNTSLIPATHWVAAILIGSYAIILFITTRMQAVRLFALVFIAAAAWFFAGGIYYAATERAIAHASMASAIFFGGPVMISLFLIYALHLHNIVRFNKLAWIGYIIIQSLVAYLYIGTDAIVKTIVFTGPRIIDRARIPGELQVPHLIAIIGMLVAAAFILTRYKHSTSDVLSQKHHRWILIGTGLTAPLLVAVVIVAPLMGYSSLVWTAPLFGIVWVGISCYAITRYGIANRALFFSQVLILCMLAVMFANIFITEATLGTIARLGVLGAFLATGAAFVHTTLREERNREELAKLTDRMEALNANLESLVAERTAEIEHARIHTDTIIEQLTHGILELSPEGTILRINEAAENLLGITRAALQNEVPTTPALSAVTYGYDGPRHEGELPLPEDLPAGADVRELSIPGTTERELQVTTLPLYDAAGAYTLVRTLRDVSRDKRISRSKNEFISVAAHQLRTPLAGIKWTLAMLLAGEMGKLSAAAREQLTRANVSNELLLLLISDLMLVSRIENGKEEYHTQEVLLQKLLRDTIETFTAFANEQNIRLVSKMPRTDVRISADPHLLERALFSLIDNAIRYNKKQGSVTISLETPKDSAQIIIRDTGIGIPPQEHDRLFSKFYRSEASIKRHTEGAGLALFITKHIIGRHGGMLRIESEHGIGTSAIITLPLL